MGQRAAHRGGWAIATSSVRSPGVSLLDATRTPSAGGGFSAMRCTTSARDKRLDVLTERWLADMVGKSRPTLLCRQFPRVANKLALCWADPHLTCQVLQDFLVDKRGGRRGFPPPVRAEMLALKETAELLRRRKASQDLAQLRLQRAY